MNVVTTKRNKVQTLIMNFKTNAKITFSLLWLSLTEPHFLIGFILSAKRRDLLQFYLRLVTQL